jgi:hypothetical protein
MMLLMTMIGDRSEGGRPRVGCRISRWEFKTPKGLKRRSVFLM